MSDVSTNPMVTPTLDVARIEDPEARRVIREMSSKMSHLQLEIDSILEVLFDKHISSIGEFRHEIVRLGQNRAKTDRMHDAIAGNQPAQPVMGAVRPPH